MNNYTVKISFTVKAENDKQAQDIVCYEIQKNIPFKGVPYDKEDSGIINFGVEE